MKNHCEIQKYMCLLEGSIHFCANKVMSTWKQPSSLDGHFCFNLGTNSFSSGFNEERHEGTQNILYWNKSDEEDCVQKVYLNSTHKIT